MAWRALPAAVGQRDLAGLDGRAEADLELHRLLRRTGRRRSRGRGRRGRRRRSRTRRPAAPAPSRSSAGAPCPSWSSFVDVVVGGRRSPPADPTRASGTEREPGPSPEPGPTVPGGRLHGDRAGHRRHLDALPANASWMAIRSARITAHCAPGRVFTTRRSVTPSGARFSTPHTSGSSSTSDTSGSCAVTWSATSLSNALARSTSVSCATRMSSSARAHCWDLLPTRMIWPFGTCHTVPLTSRRRVVRKRDGLDGADRLAAVDDVADAVLVLHQHEDAGQEVPHEALGAEAEGDADDAGPGDQRPELQPELGHHVDRGERVDHRVAQAAEHLADGLGPGGRAEARLLLAEQDARRAVAGPAHAARLGRARQLRREAADEAPGDLGRHPREQHDEQDLEGSGHQEVDELGQPLRRGVVEARTGRRSPDRRHTRR